MISVGDENLGGRPNVRGWSETQPAADFATFPKVLERPNISLNRTRT